MKKVLVIFLALVTLLSVALVACNDSSSNNGGSSGNNGGDDNDFVVQTKKDTSDTNSDTTGTGNNGSNGSSWITANIPTTVYTMWEDVRIRSEANTTSSVELTKISGVGTALNVTAASTPIDYDGGYEWFKVTYNDGSQTYEGYVSGYWVSKNIKDTKFVRDTSATAMTVATKHQDKKVSLRSKPSVLGDGTYVDDFIGTYNGTCEKVGQNESGTWYIIKYTQGADKLGPVSGEYYVKMGSDARLLFGLSTGSGGGVG